MGRLAHYSLPSSITSGMVSGMTIKQVEKIRENRLRRMAGRRDLQVQKSRRRDERANDFGLYRIVDAFSNVVVAGAHPFDYSLSLDEIEEWLNEPAPHSKRRPSVAIVAKTPQKKKAK